MSELEQVRAFMRAIRARSEMRNGRGVLQGGVIAMLADVAVCVALKPRINTEDRTIIDLTGNYQSRCWKRLSGRAAIWFASAEP